MALLTVGVSGVWAEDYSGSYYYISTSTQSHYGFYNGNNATNYGSTSAKTSAVLFKFEKTGTYDEYYWYNCTSKKYISVDESGNLLSANSYSDTDAFKWYIIDNGDGTVKITDKANYNSGSPSNALVTLGGNGSWWGVNDLSNSTYTNKAWKLIPAVEMKKPYYIGLGRGENRYLQYSSDDNKMKQVVASTKDLSHVWYFTDEGDGVINIHPITSSSAMGYASDAGGGADKISTTNTIKSFKLTPTDQTTFPIAFLASGLSATLYISNFGGTNNANMGLYGTIADAGTRMKVEDASLSVNAYIGATKTIGATEWKTQSNWLLCDTWNSNGPGYSSSNMWSPIYLNGVTATGIAFDGWALQLSLVNSSLTATTGKIQTDGDGTLTIDVDKESTLDLTLTSSNNNPGTHVFNIDGSLTINMGDNAWNNSSSTNNINLGTTGSFTFTANSAITIGTNPNFTINATLADPGASYNTVESQTLATFTNVTITTLSVNISGTDGWTSVDSKAALETQTSAGKYYFLENTSSGVVLYMYKQTVYNVPAETTVNLSEIDGYSSYEVFNVPSGATLNVDVDNFDLTKIHGAGTITFNDATTTTSNIASDFTGTLNVNNASATVTINGNLGACTLQKTLGTLNYAGNDLNGTTLDGVVLNSTTARITTSNTVNIKNLAGCNLPNPSGNYGYVFIGSGGTINLYGTCDFTKKADGTTAESSNLGYGSGVSIVVKEGATVTVGVVYNSGTDNASVTVESDAILNTIGWTHADNVLYATNLTNNGTINLSTGRLHENIGTSVVHTTLSGSGTLNIAEGATLEVSSVPSAITLSGAGTVKLTIFPNSTAPTMTDWTGAVTLPDKSSQTAEIERILNVWGNENSTIKINNLNGYFSTGATVTPTLNILSGKTLTINDGYSGDVAYPTFKKVTGEGNFSLTFNPNKVFRININTLINFTGTLTGQYKPIVVENLVLASAPNLNDRLFKTSGTVTYSKPDSKLYIGETEKTAAYAWEEKTVDEVKGYYITESVPANIADAIALVTPYYNGGHVGAGLGKYTISLGETSYANMKDFGDAVTAWATIGDCVEPTIVINMPTNGFYRFTSQNNLAQTENVGKYLHNYLTDGALALNSTEDKTTIFYVDCTNNTLLSYDNGRYLNNYNVEPAVGSSSTWTIEEGSELGKYALKWADGWYASDWNTTDNITYGRKDANALWAIEPVEELPITLNQVGANYFATFCAPLDVTLDGATAYTLSKEGTDKLRLSAGSSTVAGGTPVLLIGTSASATATITSSTAAPITDETALTGTYEAKAINGETDYVLGTDETKIGFFHWVDNTLKGFRAYLTGETMAGVKGFYIDEEQLTGIEEIVGEIATENDVIYNLAGQRLGKPQKGVNIINGKKVIVK